MFRNAVVAVVLLLAGAPAGAQRAPDPQAEVRDAERAFARSMADRDHGAFTRLVAEDAVFLGPQEAFRGRAAVAAGWKPFFEGPEAPFSWEPERVEVLPSGALAISTGPVRNPKGERVGTFSSTWRRDPDGRWRVVLDSGCPPCPCR